MHLTQRRVVLDPGVVEERADIPYVGTHGVGRSSTLGAQVTLEGRERVAGDDGHAHTVSPHRALRNDFRTTRRFLAES